MTTWIASGCTPALRRANEAALIGWRAEREYAAPKGGSAVLEMKRGGLRPAPFLFFRLCLPLPRKQG